jgi:hypothetical protein
MELAVKECFQGGAELVMLRSTRRANSLVKSLSSR